MKIEDAILYSLASQNLRTSESRIKFTCIMPSEEEEDEVNRRMRTEQDVFNYFGSVQNIV